MIDRQTMCSAPARARQRWSRAIVATLVGLTGLVLVAPAPASALTQNEKFVVAFYDDFMMRSATDDELTWWTAYLGSSSRTAMATSLLGSDEFENLWVVGTRMYYLGEVIVEDPLFASDVSALQSSDDFVATEVSTIAGARYLAINGGTNTSFVEAVYNDVLLRPSDPSGLAYWVGRLDAGTSTRAGVAGAFIRTSEAAARRVAGTSGATVCASTVLSDETSLPSGSYCIVLDRMADPSGQAYWTNQLAGSSQLPEFWATLAGSNEYFNHAQL